MKILKITKQLFVLLALCASIVGCVKDPYEDFFGVDEDRTEVDLTLVKIVDGGGDIVLRSRDINPTIDEFVLIEVRRDVRNEGVLNTPLTVKLAADPSQIQAYNDANGANYLELPTDAYEIVGDLNAVTFQPGEDVKQVMIKVNKDMLDLSSQYALAFRLVDAGGATVSKTMNTVIYSIGIKNEYDGMYSVQGYVYHPSAPRPVAGTKHLVTAGPNSVIVELGDLGAAGYYALLTVNGTQVTVTEAPGAAGAPYTAFPNGLPDSNPGYTAAWAGSPLCNNTYDPATGTFYLRYGYVGSTGWRVTEEILTRQ